MSLKLLTAMGGSKVGGAEAFFVTLNRALQARGVAVHAVLRDNPIQIADFVQARIPYDTVKFGGPADLWTTGRLRKIATAFRPDVVLTFAGRASSFMPRGEYTLIGRLGGYYGLKYFKRCDYLICNAPDLVRHVVEGGWPRARVFHIPNFPRIDEAPPVSRASLNTPKGVPVALALGRLHPNKALDVLVTAAASISDLWVWIAGEGKERSNLENLARDLGVSERVKFLGWRTDKAALFKAANLCVFPSREEPFGNVVIEAWAYGTPLVTTDSTGPAWLVRNGEDAIVTPVDDVEALADGIRSLISDSELATKLVENGKRRISEAFSEEAIVGQYLDLFDRLRAKRESQCAG
jgi:glycosyltransferase involved in cell wall biosynthesis